MKITKPPFKTNARTNTLTPHTEPPDHERWLFENKSALDKVKRGLKDSAEGRIAKRNHTPY